MTNTHIEDAHIREAAYLLWLNEGQPEGRDQEHWQKAIAALSASAVAPKPARKAPAKPRATRAKTPAKTAAAAKPKAEAKPKATAKPKASTSKTTTTKVAAASTAQPKTTTRKPRAKAAAKPAAS